MTEREIIERLCALRPEIVNIIGFYDLIDRGTARTPSQAMKYQIHLTAAAMKLANEVCAIIEDAKAV